METSKKDLKTTFSRRFKVGLLAFTGLIMTQIDSAQAGIKWYPGHYYTILPGDTPTTKWREEQMEKIYTEIASTPAIRGLQMRLMWNELESTRGNYTFLNDPQNNHPINKILARLKPLNKRLVLQVKLRGFDKTETIVPDYMKTAEFDGGIFKYGDFCGTNCTPTGWHGNGLKLWNANVKTRLLALMKALGDKYNSDPNFQGVGFIETAFGVPLAGEGVTTANYNNWFTNSMEVNRQTRLFFPNTMVMQETNFPIDMIKSYIQDDPNSLVKNGIALSCPDTFEFDDGLNRDFGSKGGPAGVYAYFKKYAGIVPIAPTVMRRNYQWTSNNFNDKTGHEPTIMEILTFARDTLKANYIFWNRVGIDSTGVTVDYYKRVLATLNNPIIRDAPNGAGTLTATCPSMYTCNNAPPSGNQAPVVSSPLADKNFQESISFAFTIPSGSFTDPDGDTLKYKVILLPLGVDLPAWIKFDPATRKFTGKAPLNSDNLSIKVIATDPGGLKVTDSFMLNTTP